jgi:hypothetical protein
MRRRTRRLLVVLGITALLVVAVRLALDPIATWRTRTALAGLEGMDASFSDVEVRLLELSYVIRDLRIEKRRAGGAKLPFFEVRRARFGVLGKELLERHLVARVDLEAPRLNLIEAPDRERKARGQEIEETPALGRRLEALAPFLLDRVQVTEGAILWIDGREPEKPRLRIHEIEATLENFATRPALARGEPTVLAARGVLQRTGRVTAFATADPLAKQLTFAGRGRVEGLQLAELGGLLASKGGVAPDKGVLDLSVQFQAVDGRLTGGLRPILKDAGTRPAEPGLRAKIVSALADASLEIFSDDVPGRDAVATTIPIAGRVDDPDLQVVPTILGVIRNAFVRGLADSLAGLPPPKAEEREGVLEQARRALSRKRGQPKAQPQPGER